MALRQIVQKEHTGTTTNTKQEEKRIMKFIILGIIEEFHPTSAKFITEKLLKAPNIPLSVVLEETGPAIADLIESEHVEYYKGDLWPTWKWPR